jgi:UDP-glucose 4-epimerase
MILVTGGAGYIGHHVLELMGHEGVAVDNLMEGSRDRVGSHDLIEEDIDAAGSAVDWTKVSTVIHCAGLIDASQSRSVPWTYWWNNVAAPMLFLREATDKKIVLASSAAIYHQMTPYGQSKYACEQMVMDLFPDASILRYFNVAGGDEDHKNETHIIPRVVMAALKDEPFEVYGNGQHLIRDYIHVDDVAKVTFMAMEKKGIYDVGTGVGHSVFDVVSVTEEVTGKKIAIKFMPERQGDPKSLVADISRISKDFGWKPSFDLRAIISSHYEWRKANLK